MRVNVTDTAITWQPVPGADRYTVEATVTAIRINAADICDAPLQQDRRELSIKESVGGAINELSFGLPEIAPDRWFNVLSQMRVTAFNAQGETIAVGGGGHVAETCRELAKPTPIASRQLPSTGTGAPQTTTSANLVFGALLATATTSVLVFAGMYSMHQRLRQRASSATRH